MGEKFEVLDETGRKTGRLKERSLVHKEGDWHGALEVHLVDPKDQTIVFQQRGFDKDTEAGKIGAAAAGHYAPGEDFKDGLREVQEEIGIKVKSIIENPASIEGTDMEVELEVGTEGIIQKTRGSLTRIKGFREAILDREEKKDDSGKVLKKRIYNRELQNTAVLLMNIDMTFEEYFLARALGSFEDGNLDILDFRRENENNITNWISLKPVIIFYCEVLFNNGEYSKLRNFLLKDLNDIDDIEGFFMGIEFIHRLHNMIESFDDKKKKEINDITHDIRLRITSWIICNKKVIELFQSFQKNIGYKPNIFVESYINNDKRKGKFKNKEEHDIEMSELLPVKINHNPKLFLNYRGNKFNDFKLHFLKENIYELYRNREKLDTQDLNKLCSLILDLEYNEEIYDLFLIFIIEKLKGYLEMGNIIGFFEKNKINNFNSIGKIKSPDILNYLFDAIKNNIKLNPTNLDNILLNLRLIGNEIMQNFIEKEIYQICKFNIRRSAFLLHYISKVDKNIFGNRCYIIFENCLDILELTDKFKLIKNSIIGSLEDANTFESKDILIRRFGITF